MGAKTGTKAGRPLKQNGKSKIQEKEEAPEGPDLSLLRKPVETSVNGLSDVVKVFQNSPPELHHLLSYECDIVYECKVCRNLFRSLANFISHKRVYCTQLQGNTQNNLFRSNKRVNDTTVIVEPESVRTTRSKESWRTSDAAGSEDKGYEPKTRNGLAEPAPFRITIKKDLTSIVEKLMQKNATQTLTETVGHLSSSSEYYDNLSKDINQRKKEAKQHTIHLEPIENTSHGVFQTVVQTSGSSELIKSQVQDLQRIMSDTEAVLGPDGRVLENGPSQYSLVASEEKRRKTLVMEGEEYTGPPVTAPELEVELFCNLCKENFSSYKKLNHHMKSLHMTFRTFYPCPCCKLPLSNSWSVFRHLLKVHRKTNEQIRKLREKVMKRSFKREVLQSGAQKLRKPNVSENPLCPSELIYDTSYKSVLLSEEENDKQWFGQHEGFDMQCCGGCGRRFERRAALLAHSQSCSKLLAAKQNVSGRASNHGEKSTNFGRQSQASKSATPTIGTTSPLMSALRQTSTLPVLPLNPSLHLSQEKQAIPTKKIEIQIRRDYGKSHITSAEYRTRTPSTSRSEDGAASLGRSDDGTTSGSSETEASGLSDKRLHLKNEQIPNQSHFMSDLQHRRGRKPSLTQQPVNNVLSGMSKSDVPLKRGVGRPRKHRPEVVHMNGVNNPKSETSSLCEGSDDSNDTKNKPSELCRSDEGRKRKAVEDLYADDESDDEDSSAVAGCSIKNDPSDEANSMVHNENKLTVLSNMKKMQCLTCRKKFKSLGNLRRHVALHIGWNRFRCIICDYRCFSKCDCISHALSMHLDPWEKDKAVAMVQDIQMDAGGSTDVQSFDAQAETGDSESVTSDPGTPSETHEKSDESSPDELQNLPAVSREGPMEAMGEIIGVA